MALEIEVNYPNNWPRPDPTYGTYRPGENYEALAAMREEWERENASRQWEAERNLLPGALGSQTWDGSMPDFLKDLLKALRDFWEELKRQLAETFGQYAMWVLALLILVFMAVLLDN